QLTTAIYTLSLHDALPIYTDAWLEDEAAINILPVDVYPKATEHIPQMIDLTRRLLDNGLAYDVDGTIYFDVSEFPGYGKLSGQRDRKSTRLNSSHQIISYA